jgi:outer membrane usher protein
MLIRSQQLPAGEYELSNLPNIYGSGEARIVITDAFGRQREEFIPYYVASRLLRPGLHEYSHNFGVTRDSVESPQPVYGAQPAVLGFHRKGINAMLTAGIQYEAMGDVVAFRPEFVFLLRNYGEVELGGGYSQRQEEAGTLGYIRYNFISNYFHVRLAYSGSSPSYKTISTTATSDPNVRYVNATLGTHSTPLGALSGMYTRQEYLSGKLTESYSVTYNMRLPKQMSFFARANRTFENGIGRDNYFVSLSMILGRWSSANVAYTQDGDKYVRSGYAQRSVPVGTGLGFRLHVSGDQDMRTTDELRSDLSLFYNAKHGMLSGRYYAQPLGVSYSTSASGSLAFTDGEFFLTRPIADSFGLVKVGQLDSVRVYFSNEYLGETDNGKLLIPHMTSYSPNVVAIEPQDVPVELSLSNTRQFVIPFFRAASVINFPVSRFQGFSGKVHISEKGKALVPDYGDIVLQNKTDSFRAPIGRKGEFYFENLPPGRYKAMVIVEKWRCQTSLDVPASESTLVELGDMHCDL